MRPRDLRLAALAFLLALAACGKGNDAAAPPRGEPAPAAPRLDLSTPEVVLAQACARLSAGDLPGLVPFLTDRGAASVRRDLEAWRALLVDPAGGPRLASRLAVPEDTVEREALKSALSGGDPAALLRLYVRADPRPPLSPVAPVARDPKLERVELTYPARDGEARRAVLVRGADGWRIDRLQL